MDYVVDAVKQDLDNYDELGKQFCLYLKSKLGFSKKRTTKLLLLM
jgi:hypothetical protein